MIDIKSTSSSITLSGVLAPAVSPTFEEKKILQEFHLLFTIFATAPIMLKIFLNKSRITA